MSFSICWWYFFWSVLDKCFSDGCQVATIIVFSFWRLQTRKQSTCSTHKHQDEFDKDIEVLILKTHLHQKHEKEFWEDKFICLFLTKVPAGLIKYRINREYRIETLRTWALWSFVELTMWNTNLLLNLPVTIFSVDTPVPVHFLNISALGDWMKFLYFMQCLHLWRFCWKHCSYVNCNEFHKREIYSWLWYNKYGNVGIDTYRRRIGGFNNNRHRQVKREKKTDRGKDRAWRQFTHCIQYCNIR